MPAIGLAWFVLGGHGTLQDDEDTGIPAYMVQSAMTGAAHGILVVRGNVEDGLTYAVLRGDPSDGLPGVKGVGDKTAAALVSRFGSVEGILAALDAGEQDGFPAGARAKLEAARDYLAGAPAVTRTVRDLPVPELDDEAILGPVATPESAARALVRFDYARGAQVTDALRAAV